MRSPLLIAIATAALLAPTAAARADACPDATLQPDATNVAQVAQATLCLLNQQRAAAGLAPLSTDDRLTAASTSYASELVAQQFFSHDAPDGTSLTDRLRAVGYALRFAGENLAWGSQSLATPAAIVDAWMHSAGHRANILDGNYQQIGIGVAPGAPLSVPGTAATYVTDFGTPPAAAPSSRSERSAAQPAPVARKATVKRHRAARRHRRARHRHHLRHHHRHLRRHRHRA
jgi:uncharacterized protein YkwD